MNNTAFHFTESLVSRIEHEEAIVALLLKKIMHDAEELMELVAELGVVALLAYIFLFVLPQLDQYTQLSFSCSVLPLLSGI
jgi:hypothetical protein